jgi:NAD(P)-dependent dehydrogenase (short-subunit alcohol dehydrogenase family)
MSSPRLSNRVALITGASRGIGAAVAERFAAEGAHVILVARTVGGLEEVDDRVRAKGGTATLVPLDLAADFDKIDQLGQSIFERFGRLDIVVGNAATLGDLSPISHFVPKTWDKVFALNVTANYRLIRSMDRLLRGSDAGRAVFVTSGVARHAVAYFGAYAASKAALETMVKMYALEVATSPLKVNLLDPGIVRTKMRAQGFPGEDPMLHPAPEEITERFVELAEPACRYHGEILSA